VRVIFRIASAENLLIIQQQLTEIKLVSWQPQGSDTTEQHTFYSDYRALLETDRKSSDWREF